MVEFALIAPTFFLMLLGIVEFGLLMFNVASSRYAAGEAAKVEAFVGASAPRCDALANNTLINRCTTIHSAGYACDADCQAVVTIGVSPVGTTSLETVNWIEVRQCPNTACPNPTCTNNLHTLPAGCTSGTYVLRNINDACLTAPSDNTHCTTYVATNRSTSVANPEYLQVTLSYRYDWKTGVVKVITGAPLDLRATYLVRLEPTKF